MSGLWKVRIALVAMAVLSVSPQAGDPPQPGHLEVSVSGCPTPALVVCVPLITETPGQWVWHGTSEQRPSLSAGWYDVIVYDENRASVRPRVKIRPGITAKVYADLRPIPGVVGGSSVVTYDKIQKMYQGWADKVLEAMRQPCLFAPPPSENQSGESYRFLWLRSFHHPILFDVTLGTDGSATVRFVETDGAGGSEPGKIVADEQITPATVLKEREGIEGIGTIVQYIRSTQAEEGFWRLPPEIDDGSAMVDGSTWIIEGRRQGECKVVLRDNPAGPFRTFAEQLIRLSGKRFYHDEYY